MGIRSFKDKNTKTFFEKGLVQRKLGWAYANKVAKRKLDILHYAKNMQDLKSPPSNCLESLKGNLKGFYSIRINKQWRIIFKWDTQPYEVQIIDYH